MNKEILIKYIKGLTSSQERKRVVEWIEENEENEEMFNSLKADWTIEHMPDTEASDDALREIKYGISPPKGYLGLITKIAAFMLIPVVLYSVYQYVNYSGDIGKKSPEIRSAQTTIPKQNKIAVDYTVNPGVKGMVLLPDGSKVWLNSDSYLKCPGDFDTTYRMVELCGEGYFNIVSNKEWPMYVKTSKGITVKVTGTEFNLTSYDNDDELKFILVKGEVTLIRESTKQLFSVNTNEEIIIPDNIHLKGKKEVADIYVNTAWKDGHLIFENTPMPEVIKRIQRWYGVKINVGNPHILNYYFTADFYSESITQVLELLKITSNIKYSVTGNRVKLHL
jgi:ferric-dicitrate binding protein FerR (iron transport regulator)